MRSAVLRSVRLPRNLFPGKRAVNLKCLSQSRCQLEITRHLLASTSAARVRGGGTKSDSKDLTLASFVPTSGQKRAAALEYEQMVKTTRRQLSQNSRPTKTAAINELQVTFQYWARHRAKWVGSKDEFTENAEALLDWISQHCDCAATEIILGSETSPNTGLLNLAENYLLPFRATHQTLLFEHGPPRQHNDIKVFQNSLQKAANIIHKMKELHNDPLFPNLIPDTYSCCTVMGLWCKRCWFLQKFGSQIETSFVASALDGVSTATGCLDGANDFIDLMKRSENYPSPTANEYNLLITAFVNSGSPVALRESTFLLRRMEEDASIPADIVSFNTVLHGYASLAQQNPDFPSEAAALLQHMQQNQQPNAVKPDVTSFSCVLLAYTNAGEAKMAEQMLGQMQRDSKMTNLHPNTVCFNIVIDAWAKSRDPNAAHHAEAVLHRMMDVHENSENEFVRPDVVSYTSVVTAWSRSLDPRGAERAESILLQMEENASQEGQDHLRPDWIMYNVILDGYAKRAEGHKAESILRRMQEEAKLRDATQGRSIKNAQSISPRTASYNIVMHAWCGSSSLETVPRVQKLFDEMQQDFEAGNDQVRPDILSYNILLLSMSRNSRIREASDLLKQMESMDNGIRPCEISYNTVMDCMIKSGEGKFILEAEEMLQTMEEACASGNKAACPSEFTYNVVLNGLAWKGDMASTRRAEKLLGRMLAQSEQTGSSLMNAYSKGDNTDAMDKAEAMLGGMRTKPNVQLTTVTFNTFINILAKSKLSDAPKRAEELLNQMQYMYNSGNKNIRPDHVSFSSVINCYAKSGQKGSAERAEAILNHMEELYRKGGYRHLKANQVTYSAVLNAWSKSGSPQAVEKANALLSRMDQVGLAPNGHCFNALINTIAKSNEPHKARHASEVFQRMQEAVRQGNKYAQPNVISYNSVINACSFTVGRPDIMAEAFRIAQAAMLEVIEESNSEKNAAIEINEGVYYQFLIACQCLLPRGDERNEIVTATFNECCKTGHVDQRVLRKLSQAIPQHLYNGLVPVNGPIKEEWERNVSTKKAKGNYQLRTQRLKGVANEGF